MSRSILYIVVGLLVAGAGAAAFLYFQQGRGGIDIQINKDGVSIDGN